jgi:hypothetical protein
MAHAGSRLSFHFTSCDERFKKTRDEQVNNGFDMGGNQTMKLPRLLQSLLVKLQALRQGIA